jgi:hypothetical protein
MLGGNEGSHLTCVVVNVTLVTVCFANGAVRLIPDSSFRDDRDPAKVAIAMVLKIERVDSWLC